MWRALSIITLMGLPSSPVLGQEPARTYWVYVAAESADLLHRIRFGPDGAVVERTINVGEMPNETEGPHGLRVSADRAFLYMTTGHGIPDGKLWKLATGVDTVIGQPIFLGRFPATLDVTPDGQYVFVANFNLHGDHTPSTVSAVYTGDLVEVAQITTCTMPHGMRMHPNGMTVYSACMMDNEIVVIDTRTLDVSHRFSVSPGHERLVMDGRLADHGGDSCSPTWAQPGPTGDVLYVVCNANDVILEVSLSRWNVIRRFQTGRGPYNLDLSPDGTTLVATLKQGGAVELWDLASGQRLVTIPSTAPVTHGVVISPDSRYAFVSVESVGADPGRVDVIDLRARQAIASVAVGQQAGGIAFWKMESGN